MRRPLLVLLAALTGALAPASAQDADRLEAIERERARKGAEAEALRERTDAANAALRRLQASLVTLADELQASEAAVTASEAALARLTARQGTLTTRLAARRRAIGDVLGALQMLERGRPPALLVSPDDANRAAVAAIALQGVTPELAAEAERLAVDLERIEAVRALAEGEQRRLASAQDALADRRRLLEDTLSEQERRQAADVVRLRRIEAEDQALAREATSLRALIAGIDARDEARAPSVPPPARKPVPELPSVALYDALPDSFADARARLPLPAAGSVVQRFGERVAGGGRSQDLSLRTRPGAVVTAPFGGTVKWAKPYGALGNIVILDVGEGYTLVLIGLGGFDVRRDDAVRAGTPLGTMPQGRATLRMHLRRGSEVIDPEPWLRPEALAARAP